MLEKYLRSRKQNERELKRAQEQHRFKRHFHADRANAVGGAPYFEDAAASRHETEETDLYPHPHNVPIPVSEQSLRLKSLKRQVDYSNHDYEGYENEPVRDSGRSHRGGVDHADSYDQGYEQDDRERDTDADE